MMNCKSAKLTTKIPTILFYEIINTTNINKKKTIPSHLLVTYQLYYINTWDMAN